ncbi:MAG: MTH1187 family thiamine-binding protein [Candidatus Omnitrophota bacterium]
MEISVIPIGTCETSISRYVAKSEEPLAKAKSIKSEVTAMGTIIEAPSLRKLFDIAAKMHNKALSAGARRVFTSLTIDDRLDKKLSIKGKIKSLKNQIQA